ncbi:MAG: Rrf2 family transcriptional regulator, partial [Pseudomonadota bacterium]
AVTAMIDLALHAKVDHVALVDVAVRQNLSLAYLEQLFRSLKKARLVDSVRGAKGGYRLARDEKSISLADILIAAGEKLNLACGAGDTCSEVDPCLTHDIWNGLSKELLGFLDSKSLYSLAKSKHVQQLATQQDTAQIGNIPIEVR